MEVGGHGLAEKSQRRVAVGPITQIAEDLIEGTVFLHDVDNMLDFGMKEFHYPLVLVGESGLVSIIGGYLRRQIPEFVRGRDLSADERCVFQLKLILVV